MTIDTIRNRAALEMALTADGIRHKGGLRHPDGFAVTAEQIEQWTAVAEFVQLVNQVTELVAKLKIKLEAAGLSADLIDGELRAQVTETYMVASVLGPAPAPEAQSFQGMRPSTRRAWAEE